MKYIDGMTLRDLQRSRGKLPLAEVCRLLEPVASALDYAHKNGVVHRDIKPDNIMVGRVGGDPQIVDFGLAADAGAAGSVSGSADGAGTLPYISPEQWQHQNAGPASDQYALAIVAYELISGRLPFADRDHKVLRQQVLSARSHSCPACRPRCRWALGRALAKQPRDRYGSCQDFVRAISAVRAPTLPPNVANASKSAMPLPPPAGGGIAPLPAIDAGKTGEIPMLPTGAIPATTTKLPGTSAEMPMLPDAVPRPPQRALLTPPRASLQSTGEMPVIPPSIVAAPKVRAPRDYTWLKMLLAIAVMVTPAILLWNYLQPPAGVDDEPVERAAASVERTNRSGDSPATGGTAPLVPDVTPPVTEASTAVSTAGSPQPAAPVSTTPAIRPGVRPPGDMILGRSQLLALMDDYGLALSSLADQPLFARAGAVAVGYDSNGEVQAIYYQRTDSLANTDIVYCQFGPLNGTNYLLTIEVRFTSTGAALQNSARIDRLQGRVPTPLVSSSVQRTTPAPSVVPTPGSTSAPSAGYQGSPRPSPSPDVSTVPRTPVSRERPSTASQALSLAAGQLSVDVEGWPVADGTWVGANSYSVTDGENKIEYQLYAPDDWQFAIASESATASRLVQLVALSVEPRELTSIDLVPSQNRLRIRRSLNLSPDVKVALNRCLLRVIGAEDRLVLPAVPLVGPESNLQIRWKRDTLVTVPAGVADDLKWRLFLRWTPWNTSHRDWVEVSPARQQDPAKLKFVYDLNEPISWGNGYGARKYDVRLHDMTFIATRTTAPGGLRGYDLHVQGVQAGWTETHSDKQQLLNRADANEQARLQYELRILDALSNTNGSPGTGFEACLVGYETLNGPRVLSDDGTTYDRGDSVEVARVVLGQSLDDLSDHMLVRRSE
ncbi:MAG: protein kinase [Planctomycetaceae bacterium]